MMNSNRICSLMKPLLSLLVLTGLALASHAADFEQAVNDLIPKLANADVPKRYNAQMQLQELASDSSKPGNDADRTALGKVLAAKVADESVPQPARVWMVRQLEYMGREEAVEALTQLLKSEDGELRECARRALEKNPAPAAVANLWAAFEKAAKDQSPEGARWKIGLMHSLAQRGDTSAVRLIIPCLQVEATASAAAVALGQIANDSAVEALWSAFPDNRFAGESLINAANLRLANGDQDAAKAIYAKLDTTNNPVALRAAALFGLIKSDPANAEAVITEGLTSSEPKLQQAVVSAAGIPMRAEAAPILARLLPKISPDAKLQVLPVLGASAEPAVIDAAADSDPAVRAAALEALGRLGGAASIPVLLKAASSEDRAEQNAANTALGCISGSDVGNAIIEAAAQGDSKVRVVAIDALTARHVVSALPSLLKYATETDATVRKAALKGLGRLGGDQEIEPLGKLVLATKDADTVAALEAVAERVTDKPAAAQKLLVLAGNNEAAKATLVKALATLGGADAVATVSQLMASTDAQTQEAAVRALVDSTDFAATKPLLAVAANPQTGTTQYILSLAAVVRLVKTSETQPAADRAATAVAAMKAARRDQDKKMVLSAFGTIPHADAAAAVKVWLANPALKAEAAQAGISLAELLVKTNPTVAKDLAQAIKTANVSRNLTSRANKIIAN